MAKSNYVVILTSDTGYIQCVGVCETYAEAIGRAYASVSDGYDDSSLFHVTIPIKTEGEQGWGIHLINTEIGDTIWSAFVLENNDEGNTAKFI